ncbi:MAG: MTAP family purine nucleoside phosphorylase [Armatimonadota bacterium]
MDGLLAVIGGSQAYTILESGEISGERIPPQETPFGKSQSVVRLEIEGWNVLFMSRHGEHGYSIAAPWVNYRANIWALKELGTAHIVSWSGPGAIDQSLRIGQFVIPSDIIDETKSREYSYFKGTGWGFVRQNPVFCPSLQEALTSALDSLNLEYRSGGTYVCTEGPRLETPAEICKFQIFGGDMVGMTLVPEAFLARELEMCYAPVCYITNYAEGLRDRPFKPGVLFEGLLDDDERKSVDDAVKAFPRIIHALSCNIRGIQPSCHCDKLMDRYRRRGDIGPDWHTWIYPKESV